VADVRGTKIAVAKVGGTYYAFDDRCTHQQCSLAEGDLAGTTVTCMCHGAEFDVRTGEVLALLLLAHVVEPVRAFIPGHIHAANVDSERRDRAERCLQALADAFPPPPRTEPLVVFGEPAEEIAKTAADRQAGLIVMGLHASAVSGARMGSVTYRVLSVTHGLVLALPPPRTT
jgi:nucleotide-binding universal stress UspA family protein